MPRPIPPSVLYKYYPPERLSFFDTLQVKFSRPSEMNDTFDSHYLVPSGELARSAKIERMKWRSKLGILSLTESADNHLMWVHYAKNHTGFVIGFHARDVFFREDGRILKDVTYREGPAVLEQADMDACFTKSNIWDYEKEWRCVREFEDKESRLIDVSPEIIKEIIFGYQLQDWQISKIISWVKLLDGMNIPPITFKRAMPSRSAWDMEILLCPWTACPHCDGSGFIKNQ